MYTFTHQAYVRVLETDTTTNCGTVNLEANQDIKYIVFDYYYQGVSGFFFDFRAHIYGSAQAAGPIYSSDWVELGPETLGATVGGNRRGQFWVEFPDSPLNEAIDFYIKVETSGYTRAGDSSYFSLLLDWYDEVNDSVVPNQTGVRMRIIGMRELES